jgi:hypothetical protein
VKEELLHYIWKFQLFDAFNLKTLESESIEIIKPGEYNRDSGPDFSNAHIKINDILFIGNIEIHVSASDWKKHKHDKDSAYNSVILHVVLDHDMDVNNSNGINLPTLQLKHLIFPYVTQFSPLMIKPNKKLICKNQVVELNGNDYLEWMNDLYFKRLKNKIDFIKEVYYSENKNIQHTLYKLVALSFGFKTNALAFDLLSKELSFHLVQTYLRDPLKTESLLYGVAGFLDKPSIDEHHHELQKEFLYLQKTHNLNSLPSTIWKFSRMHPQNFPSIRIAQFSTILPKFDFIINQLNELNTFDKWANELKLNLSSYWQTHYDFGKKINKGDNQLGDLSINSIIINVIVPFLFFYSEITNNKKMALAAKTIINTSLPEKNSIVNLFSKVLPKPTNALFSQAFIQLEKELCAKSGCLSCLVGKTILQST